MKKNEIRFVSTESGINCEGTCVLSKEDRNKCEEMLQQVQNAAKDCGASISLTPTGIQLGFNVACSCGMDAIHEAAARMKCIIEQIKDFIANLEIPHEQSPEEDADEEAISKQQSEEIRKFFDEMKEKYPNANITIICEDGEWTSVTSNMHPMHVLHCMIGALKAEKHGENQ